MGKKQNISEDGGSTTSYYIVDHSRNGTYCIRADDTDKTPTLVGKGQVDLHVGDKIVMMFKGESKCEYVFEAIAEDVLPGFKSPPGSSSSSSTADEVFRMYRSENKTLQEENKQLKDRLDEEKEKYRVLEKELKTTVADKAKLEKEMVSKDEDMKVLNSTNSAITARCQVIYLVLPIPLPLPPLVLSLYIHPQDWH